MQNSNKLTSKQKRILGLSILGTCLEFYDFTLFSVFAVQIGKTFFTSTDPLVSTISALGAFAAGFLMRPIGALVLGYIGDKYSRRSALSLSIILMGIPPLIVSIMPGYEVIGITAPLLLLFFRLLQGFSAGGEFNGAAIYILENLPKEKKAFYSSLISASGGMGAILAFIIGAILSTDSMPKYAFRFAFFIGASVSLVGFILRRRTAYEPELNKNKLQSNERFAVLRNVLKKHKASLLTCFSIGALDGALAYSVAGFVSVYLSQFIGVKLSSSMSISALCLAFYIVMTPLVASCYDRLKKKKFFTLFLQAFSFSAYSFYIVTKPINYFNYHRAAYSSFCSLMFLRYSARFHARIVSNRGSLYWSCFWIQLGNLFSRRIFTYDHDRALGKNWKSLHPCLLPSFLKLVLWDYDFQSYG